MLEPVIKCNSVSELIDRISKRIDEVDALIEEYSNFLGEKIRTNQADSEDEPEIKELKERLEGGSDEKKKKPQPKKRASKQWYDLNGFFVYHSLGLKGELELYFKGLNELKTKRDSLQKFKQTLEMILEKGLKEEMGCVVFQKDGVPLEMAFIKSSITRKKFSFQSLYHLNSK